MNRGRITVAKKPLVSGVVENSNVSIQQGPPLKAPPPASLPTVEPVSPMPILTKDEPVAPEESPDPVVADIIISDENGTVNNSIAEYENGGKISFKKIFQKRKKSSERIRDKKLRQNRQLRKSMLPKNALIALNEVEGISISDFTINNNPDGGFKAIVTVNSGQYEGKGPSKMLAKIQACEKALRDYIISKMTPRVKKIRKAATAGGPEPMDADESDTPPENDVPMMNLASFAIYKLFAEWEREGYVVPEMNPSIAAATALQTAASSTAVVAVAVPKEPKKPPVRTELPLGWETMHPATLLCIMRPGLSYADYGATGEKPSVIQCMGVIVDNVEFTANGRSKKIARRNVAVNVCNTLFNTNFVYEEY